MHGGNETCATEFYFEYSGGKVPLGVGQRTVSVGLQILRGTGCEL